MLSLTLSKEMEMLKNYAKELVAIAAIFGLIGYGIYVCAAPKQKDILTATRGHEVEAPPKAAPAPAPKKDAKADKPAKATKEVKKEEPKKDPNRKKPTLKAKYADKNN